MFISKNFKNDTVGKALSLTPLLIITNYNKELDEHTILYSFSDDRLLLKDDSDNSIRFEPILERLSNVKSTTDYDSKKLKINRMRFTLYNYYDIKKKLGDVFNIDSSLVGKNIYLYYKSQSTDVVSLPTVELLQGQTLSDDSCALVFSGVISRISSRSDTINIQAEDATQFEISDKLVPYFKLDYLNAEDWNKIPNFDSTKSIPMVYGAVDKAPCIMTYGEQTDEGYRLKVIHDRHYISDTFSTNPIAWNVKHKKTVDTLHGSKEQSWIYAKKDEEYMMVDNYPVHKTYDVVLPEDNGILTKEFWNNIYNLNSLYSMPYTSIKLDTQTTGEATYVFNEYYDDEFYENNLKIKAINYIYPTGAFSSQINDSIWYNGFKSLTLDNSNLNGNYSTYDNGGHKRKWYRYGDPITSQLNIEEETHSQPLMTHSVNDETSGNWNKWESARRLIHNRYTLLKLNKSEQLRNGYISTRIYQPDDLPNSSSINNGILHHYSCLLIMPVDMDLWKVLQDGYTDGASSSQDLVDVMNEAGYGNLGGFWQSNNDFSNFYTAMLSYIEMHSSESRLNSRQVDSSTNSFWNYNTLSNFAGSSNYVGDYIHSATMPSYSYIDDRNHNGQSSFSDEITFRPRKTGWASGAGSNALHYAYGSRLLTSFETDKVVVIECPIRPFDPYDNAYTPSGDVTLGYEIQNCAFSTQKDVEIKDKYFASVTGRSNILFTLPSISFNIADSYNQIPDLTIASLLGGADGTVTSGFYDNIIEDMWQQILSIQLDWEVYHSWVQNIEGTSNPYSPSEDYYELTPYIDDILKPLENFKYIPNTNLDDSALHLSPYIFESIIFPFWKQFLWFWIEVTINRNLSEDGTSFTDENEFATLNENMDELYQNDYHSLFRFFNFYAIRTLRYFYGYSYITNADETWVVGALDSYAGDGYSIDSVNPTNSEWSVLYGEVEGFTGLCSNSNNFFNQLGRTIIYCYLKWKENKHGLLATHVVGYGTGGRNYKDLEFAEQELYQVMNGTYIALELGADPSELTSSGLLDNPIEIMLHILSYEMGFSISGDFNPLSNTDYPLPTSNKYDISTINKARESHSDWKMGFAIDKQENGKKLFEKILEETKSYMKFTQEGRLGFITIDNSYTYDDIDYTIKAEDIINYNITKTKPEDIITSSNYHLRYDNGMKNYILETGTRHITDLLTEYDPDYYSQSTISGFDEKNLRYHTDLETAIKFQEYELLNKANQHNVIDLELPLSYMMETGSIIHLELINDTLAFGMDYSKVSWINGQYVYPLWIVMQTDIGMSSVKIKAYQLHYLNTDGLHGFLFPDEDSYEIIGCTEELSGYEYPDGNLIPNWNYNPNATTNVLGDVSVNCIPYLDINGDGAIDVADLLLMIDKSLNNIEWTQGQMERGDANQDGVISILDVISLMYVILEN